MPDRELKARYADLGVISEDEGRGYFAGDNVQLAIGQGLLSATPLQLAIGYATIANQGFVFQPKIVKAIWNPGVPDGEPGSVDFSAGHDLRGVVQTTRSCPPDPDARRDPAADRARPAACGRADGGCGVESDFYHLTTGENLFYDYPDDAIPIAGKTGTAQGASNFPWNDSSVFTGFSIDEAQPVRRDRLPREVGLRIAGRRARRQVHVPRAVGHDADGARRASRIRSTSTARRAAPPHGARRHVVLERQGRQRRRRSPSARPTDRWVTPWA